MAGSVNRGAACLCGISISGAVAASKSENTLRAPKYMALAAYQKA